MTPDPSVDRALRSYRRLWRLYPAEFRARFEDAAMEAFELRYRDARARSGIASLGGFWLRTVANVVVHGLAERASEATRGALTSTRTDLSDVLRTVRRGWRKQLPAVLCIAIGVSATSAVLTFVSGTLLRPVPFPDGERLVRVWKTDQSVELAGRGQLSYPDLVDVRDGFRTLDRFVVSGRARMMFLGEDGARRVEGEAIGPGYLDLLGITPELGRSFTAEDHRAAAAPAMLLAHATWSRDFGADPGIVGRTLDTARGSFTVVGVLPEHFLGTVEEDIPDIEFWIPLEQYVTELHRTSRSIGFIWTIGRLGGGSSLDQARQEARALEDRLAAAGVIESFEGYWVEPFGENWRGDVRWRGLLLLGGAGLLLLVAATNVAGLFIARAVARGRELAVRASLGASATRLLRHTLLETGVVAAVGGLLGAASAPALLDAFLRLAPLELPGYVSLEPDAGTLALVVSVIVLTAVVAGVAPALLSARVAPGAVLRGGGRTATDGPRARRAGRALVIGEVALTTVLLSTAALLVESYRTLHAIEVGYRTSDILKLGVFADAQDVPDEELEDFYRRVKATLLEEPRIRTVGLASPTVPPGFADEARARWDGMPDALRESGVLAYTHRVDAGLLPVMDIELLAGRGLRPEDEDGRRPVAVISEALAELMGGTTEAVGRTLMLNDGAAEVVGVVEDVLYLGPAVERALEIDVYLPLGPSHPRVVSVAARVDGDPWTLVGPARARLARLSPRSPLDWIATVESDLDGGLRSPRFYIALLLGFAGSALLLTGAGLYAILSHKVAGERTAIGIRRAFGASRMRVGWTVFASGGSLCAIGLGIGVAGSVAVGWLLGQMVFGLDHFEPLGAASAIVMIALVAVAAAAIPGVRAARTSPLESMRDA